MKYNILISLFISLALLSCKKNKEPVTEPVNLQLISISLGTQDLKLNDSNEGQKLDQPLVIRFSQALDTTTVGKNILLSDSDESIIELLYSYLDNNKTVSLRPVNKLSEKTSYTLQLKDGLKGSKGEVFTNLLVSFETLNPPLEILGASIDGQEVMGSSRISGISLQPEFSVLVSPAISVSDLVNHSSLKLASLPFDMDVSGQGDTLFTFKVTETLPDLRKFSFSISSDLGTATEREFSGYQFDFYTQLDSSYKFPEITDEELLDLVQEQTFKYFWDFAHPVSGLTRERNTSGETVTSGGSGFGIMAIIVGIERNYITREEGIQRLNKIVNFLATADRFHGVWSHWLNGSTGKVIPFSSNDNGGDIVETSYLIMGLLTFRQYLNPDIALENTLIENINTLVDEVEWDWYRQNNQNVLYWHWSPNYFWEKNHKLQGYNEALITYVVAAASKTHGIPAEVYHQGWARNGSMINGNTYYNIKLPLGNQAYGGPLFFEQYTYLGLDPRNLSDTYADYWEQVVNHTLINRAYCIDNPKNYISYSESCWGLTASDGNSGYSAHSPTNDRGVITPTAAISSLPFTPEESMEVIRHFYYLLGDRIWGSYGFHDAFNATENWYASSYLAIDQGPIILMIENYRTQLLWNLFMSCPEIQDGLDLLGFNY